MTDTKAGQRLVVKVGTNMLTGGQDRLSRPVMLEVVRQIATLVDRGHEVALVSSGAIVAGREALQASGNAGDILFKQALAAVGQPRLMQTWDQLFSHYGLLTAQTLVTRADLEDRQRYLNARNTLRTLFERRVVPIVNENDVVAVEEIKIGDNDNLSALVARVVDAALLVLLTDTDGLYTADPRRHADASLIAEVATITPAIIHLAEGAGTTRGTGGMVTKIQAARVANEAGIPVVIASGTGEHVLTRLVAGDAVGTRFLAEEAGRDSRRRWILEGLVDSASIVVDAEAGTGVVGGASLTPASVLGITGAFDRGDTVQVEDASNQPLACGVANYGATDLDRIKGCRASQIDSILGYHYGDEVIHRDNLVVL